MKHDNAGALGAALVHKATDVRILACDAGVSIATAYRYLHEARSINVNAHHELGFADGVTPRDPEGSVSGGLPPVHPAPV